MAGRKILQLVYELASGGAERFVVDLSNELVGRGEEVTVLMLRDASKSEYNFNCGSLSPEVKLVDLKLKEGFRLSHIQEIEKTIDRIRPDVVHTHLGVLPYVFFCAFRRKNTRFVHTIHSVAQFEAPSKLVRMINRILFKRRIQAVTISKVCDETYRQYYGLRNSVCIENGRAKVLPSPLFESVVKELKDLPRPIFIHVARCSVEKNQDLLVNAFNKLRSDGIVGSLLIIGNNYGSYPEIQRRACPDIHFLGEKRNVGDYLMNADYFCLSSIVEGMPISIIEAFSCGLPVISTPAGGVNDMVDNRVNGLLTPDYSVDSYEAAMKEAIGMQFDKESVIKSFEAGYSITACTDKYLKLYYHS